MARELILSCFHARTVAHFLHLTTRSYAAHKALNEFYDEIIDLVDSFAEAYQGEYGLIDFGGDEVDLTGELATFYKDALPMLDDLREGVDQCGKKLHKDDTHLHNILDEFRSLIAATQYKLRFLK